MYTLLLGVGMQYPVISGIDGYMSDVETSGGEEQQISGAQLVQANLSAFLRLIIGDAGKLNPKRISEHTLHKRRTVERIRLLRRSAEFIRGIQVFPALVNHCLSLLLEQRGASVIREFRLGRYISSHMICGPHLQPEGINLTDNMDLASGGQQALASGAAPGFRGAAQVDPQVTVVS